LPSVPSIVPRMCHQLHHRRCNRQRHQSNFAGNAFTYHIIDLLPVFPMPATIRTHRLITVSPSAFATLCTFFFGSFIGSIKGSTSQQYHASAEQPASPSSFPSSTAIREALVPSQSICLRPFHLENLLKFIPSQSNRPSSTPSAGPSPPNRSG
jgi:hypothetical protein